MKRGRAPTAAQKRWLSMEGLNPSDWFVVKWTATEAELQNRQTKEVKRIQFFD